MDQQMSEQAVPSPFSRHSSADTRESPSNLDGRHADVMTNETSLSIERTRLAYERTMMAWIRTATSLITFGFSVYKFFQIDRLAGDHGDRLVTTRGFGIVLISLGLFSLLLATIEHIASMRMLRKEFSTAQYSLAALLAGVIAILGILALLAAIFRQ